GIWTGPRRLGWAGRCPMMLTMMLTMRRWSVRCLRRLRPRRCPGPPPPDYVGIHRELRRKGVTLELLWMEYKQAHPKGYQYSQFCWLYQQWAGRVDLVMRHQHRAGDKL